MPWKIVQRSGCPADKPYAVVNKDTGRKMGCHPTREAASKQLAALYANVPDAKSEQKGVSVPKSMMPGGMLTLGKQPGEQRVVSSVEVRTIPEEESGGKHQFWARVINFDRLDDYNTTFSSDAFDESLSKRLPRFLYGHAGWNNLTNLVGKAIDYKKQPDGLDMLFEMDDFDAVPSARQVWAQLQSRTLDQFSVGFERLADEPDPVHGERGAKRITKSRLFEVSSVLEGSVPDTKLLAMSRASKAALADPLAEVLLGYLAGQQSFEDALAEIRALPAKTETRALSDVASSMSESMSDLEDMIAAVDATIDQALTTIDDNPAQAKAILSAGQVVIDRLMNLLNIDDPDDMAERSARWSPEVRSALGLDGDPDEDEDDDPEVEEQRQATLARLDREMRMLQGGLGDDVVPFVESREQERDDHGRFGSGNGDKGNSGKTPTKIASMLKPGDRITHKGNVHVVTKVQKTASNVMVHTHLTEAGRQRPLSFGPYQRVEAAARDVVPFVESREQERDDHGRFAGGGGSEGSSKPGQYDKGEHAGSFKASDAHQAAKDAGFEHVHTSGPNANAKSSVHYYEHPNGTRLMINEQPHATNVSGTSKSGNVVMHPVAVGKSTMVHNDTRFKDAASKSDMKAAIERVKAAK